MVIGIARMVQGAQGLTRENQIEHDMETGILENIKDWIAWLILGGHTSTLRFLQLLLTTSSSFQK